VFPFLSQVVSFFCYLQRASQPERDSALGLKNTRIDKKFFGPKGLGVLVQHLYTRVFFSHMNWADLLETWHWEGDLTPRLDACIIIT